jgi:hypothetical protein
MLFIRRLSISIESVIALARLRNGYDTYKFLVCNLYRHGPKIYGRDQSSGSCAPKFSLPWKIVFIILILTRPSAATSYLLEASLQ